MISHAAMKAGFGGGVVIDYPHSAKARKMYLVIYAGHVPHGYRTPEPLSGDPAEDEADEGDDAEECEENNDDSEADDDDGAEGGIANPANKRARCERSSQHGKKAKQRRQEGRPSTGTKEWVLMKKAERRRFGLKTTADSKYTMRPRKPRF